MTKQCQQWISVILFCLLLLPAMTVYAGRVDAGTALGNQQQQEIDGLQGKITMVGEDSITLVIAERPEARV